jgi:hypothetical protein
MTLKEKCQLMWGSEKFCPELSMKAYSIVFKEEKEDAIITPPGMFILLTSLCAGIEDNFCSKDVVEHLVKETMEM